MRLARNWWLREKSSHFRERSSRNDTKKTSIGREAETAEPLKVDIDFWLVLEIETVGKVPRGVTKAIYESFVEGQTVKVYAVEDTYVIPAFEVDDSQSIRLGKILFLGVSYVPVLLGLFGLCFVCVGMLLGRKR